LRHPGPLLYTLFAFVTFRGRLHMNRTLYHIVLTAAIIITSGLVVAPSMAQDALDRLRGLGQGDAGGNPQPAQPGQVDPALPQIPHAPAQQKIVVPDWVKPGLRVVYR